MLPGSLFGKLDWLNIVCIIFLIVFYDFGFGTLRIDNSQKFSFTRSPLPERKAIPKLLDSRIIVATHASSDGVINVSSHDSLKFTTWSKTKVQTAVKTRLGKTYTLSNSVKLLVPVVRGIICSVDVSQNLYQTSVRNSRNTSWRKFCIHWICCTLSLDICL